MLYKGQLKESSKIRFVLNCFLIYTYIHNAYIHTKLSYWEMATLKFARFPNAFVPMKVTVLQQ
jgi:hypothetical protein